MLLQAKEQAFASANPVLKYYMISEWSGMVQKEKRVREHKVL
jgi:hypothetical protein